MEYLFTQFENLGLAGIAIGALSYVTYKLIIELRESRINYQSFVQDNNHTTTDLVRESTATMVEAKNTMVEVKNSIREHNEVLKMLTERLNK